MRKILDIDWNAFCDYYGVSLEDLIENENTYTDYEVEHYVDRAINEVLLSNPENVTELLSNVVMYLTDFDNLSDEAAYEGVSDAGLLIGVMYSRNMILSKCRQAFQ